MKKTGSDEEMTVERAIARMEEIQSAVQSGEISLSESVALLEEATKLYRFSTQKLDELENRVKILVQGEDEKLSMTPFEVQE